MPPSLQDNLRLLAESKTAEAEWYAECKDAHEEYDAEAMMEFSAAAEKDAATANAAADRLDALEAALDRIVEWDLAGPPGGVRHPHYDKPGRIAREALSGGVTGG